jgi:hypothetical protein
VKHFGAAPLAPNRSFFWHKMSSTELVLVHVGAKFGWRHRCSLRRQTAWRRYSSQRTAPDPLAPTVLSSVPVLFGAESVVFGTKCPVPNRSRDKSAPSLYGANVVHVGAFLIGADIEIRTRRHAIRRRHVYRRFRVQMAPRTARRQRTLPMLYVGAGRYGAELLRVGAVPIGADTGDIWSLLYGLYRRQVHR